MMVDKAERKILDMVEQGQISAEEGLRLINAMNDHHEPSSEVSESLSIATEKTEIQPEDIFEPSSSPRISEEEMQRMNRLKRWWILPFGIGLLITILGAIWMYSGYLANGFGWGFWLAWIPFLLGIGIIALSYQTSRSVWLHVRIKQKPGETPQRISISLPMPIKL
ncbi:MAG: SHOCT-like domain-containing protein, partial [Anaerolineales bacterium]